MLYKNEYKKNNWSLLSPKIFLKFFEVCSCIY